MEENIKQEILNVRKELFDMKQNILHPEWIHKVGLMIDKLDIIVSRVELPVMLRATEIKLYRPYYLGSDDGDYNGEDILFITEDKAWDYIHGQCCNICKEVNNGVGSQCESEWYVVEYDSCEST